jgi:hypothetical protein
MASKKRIEPKRSRKSSPRPKTRTGRSDASAASRRTGAELPAGLELEALQERTEYSDTSPVLTGGDVDADWQRAAASGEESVGGTVATPDQDVVDDLGRAVGVERAPDGPFRASSEILDERDRRRAHQPE